MDNMFTFFDMLVLLVGAYLIYAWYLLKFKGEVKENLLLAKEYPYKRCKDKDGYRSYIAPRLLILAIVAIIAGGLGLANDYMNFMGAYYMIFALLFFLVVIWFAMAIKKGYKLFW